MHLFVNSANRRIERLKMKNRSSRIRRTTSKAFLIVVLFVLFVTIRLSGQDMKPLSSSLARSIAASGRKTVAVVDFSDLQDNVTEIGKFLAEELSVNLVADAKGFEVIERTQFQVILKEHQLSNTGVIDPQNARKLGQIAGVDALVTGTITTLSDTVHLSAKLLDTKTAKMLGAATADLPRTKAIEELLQQSIAVTGPSESPSRDTDSPKKITPSKSAPSPVIFSAKDCVGQSVEFTFTPKTCRRQREGVLCSVELVNKGEKGIRFYVLAADSSLVDQEGNQYKLEKLLVGQVQDMQLEPEIPINIVAVAEKISDRATGMHLLMAFYAGNCGGGTYNIGVKNIPIEQR